MKEENKKSKKKILLYYLILAACLLVIAAITVTVIFTVNRSSDDGLIDNKPPIENPDDKNPGGDNKPDDKDPDDDKNPDDKPTGGDNEFGLPMENANVTASYEFVYDQTLDRYCVHKGMDFKGSKGDEVCAVLAGTITEVVTDSHIGENYVTVKHDNGITSTYKYITAKEGLSVGNTVKRGDVLGTIAEAAGMEMKQGEHLHFEMSVNGKPADPDVYLNLIEK